MIACITDSFLLSQWFLLACAMVALVVFALAIILGTEIEQEPQDPRDPGQPERRG